MKSKLLILACKLPHDLSDPISLHSPPSPPSSHTAAAHLWGPSCLLPPASALSSWAELPRAYLLFYIIQGLAQNSSGEAFPDPLSYM